MKVIKPKVAFIVALNQDSSVTIACVEEGEPTMEETLAMAQNFSRYLADASHIPLDMFISALREIESEIKGADITMDDADLKKLKVM